MQAFVQGLLSQSIKMEIPERLKRFRRSFESPLSFRKTVALACLGFVFLLYFGPSFLSWLFGYHPRIHVLTPSCIDEKLKQHETDIQNLNAHVKHRPVRPGDLNHLPYVGNGFFGLSDSESEQNFYISAAGHYRTLSVPVQYKPIVHVIGTDYGDSQSAKVVNYVQGLIHDVTCFEYSVDSSKKDISISKQIFAHRSIPEVLVQEIKIHNPSGEDKFFRTERLGMSNWPSTTSREKMDGDQKYVVISGIVSIPISPVDSSRSTAKNDQVMMVAIVVPKLDDNIRVKARMTFTQTYISAISYSKPMPKNLALDKKDFVENEAINAITKATNNLNLRDQHTSIWKNLWTTGFGISHSMAEDAINGAQINATMYYVLSQVPTPLHSIHPVDKARQTELQSYLAYLEGCYGGLPTLQAKNLWKSLGTLEEVNRLVSLWILTLHHNGCHNLVKAGADGVIQAMVLSFSGLAFKQQHLELNSHPKDLHRDYIMRRVGYGNATHLNISIIVGSDNKAVLSVALDRRNKDYFACDAGCLDPPVQLSTIPINFPVKLTDPVTAVLYITSDYQHMQELKHTIHVKEVVHAPAHEHHVIALHKHGNKLGGLPAIFWFSIGFLIFVFHVFLIKLIWQEYCSSQDRYRARKFSDFE